jgi:hypothetical protein
MNTDRWTGSTAPVHESMEPSLNADRPSADLRPRFNKVKQYSPNRILDVDLRIYAGDLIRPNCYARLKQRGGGAERVAVVPWLLLIGAGQGRCSSLRISARRSPRQSGARGELTYVIVGLVRAAAYAGSGVSFLGVVAHGEGGPLWFSNNGEGQSRVRAPR